MQKHKLNFIKNAYRLNAASIHVINLYFILFNAYRLNAASHNILRKSDLLDR